VRCSVGRELTRQGCSLSMSLYLVFDKAMTREVTDKSASKLSAGPKPICKAVVANDLPTTTGYWKQCKHWYRVQEVRGDETRGGLTMSKRIYSKEEVICDRQQNVSKTGSSGRNSSMQPHRRQRTGEDGQVKEEENWALTLLKGQRSRLGFRLYSI